MYRGRAGGRMPARTAEWALRTGPAPARKFCGDAAVMSATMGGSAGGCLALWAGEVKK